jgi:hypothetical protein
MIDNNESTQPAPELPPPEHPVRLLKPTPLLVRLVTQYNPFYLLSAACMLASCLALTNTVTWNPIATRRLLTLILTLNLYEAAVLAIALFLVTRRGHIRDGRMLLLLQAFFLVDFTFLNAEIATSAGHLSTGILVNAILFLLAAVKIGVVLRLLKPNFTPLQYAFVMIQLAVLFVTPCLFRWINLHHHDIGRRDFYVLWWLTALIPALYELFAHLDRHRAAPADLSHRAQAAPTTTYLALPYLSILTHFGILQYVYDTSFYGANAAPVLLGLTLILNRVNPTTLMPRKDLATLRALLPAAAVLVSIGTPFTFEIHSTYPVLVLTPLKLALPAAFLTYVYCFFLPHARLLLATGGVAIALYILGPSRDQLLALARSAWQWSRDTADSLLPKTTADWGLLGLFASFALLALGFWVSLSRRPTPPAPSDPTPVA